MKIQCSTIQELQIQTKLAGPTLLGLQVEGEREDQWRSSNIEEAADVHEKRQTAARLKTALTARLETVRLKRKDTPHHRCYSFNPIPRGVAIAASLRSLWCRPCEAFICYETRTRSISLPQEVHNCLDDELTFISTPPLRAAIRGSRTIRERLTSSKKRSIYPVRIKSVISDAASSISLSAVHQIAEVLMDTRNAR